MSIKNCFAAAGIELTGENIQLAAAQKLVERFQAIQELNPKAELEGIGALLEFIEQQTKPDMLNFEDMIDDSIPPFLTITEENTEDAILAPSDESTVNSDYMFGYDNVSELPVHEVIENILEKFSTISPLMVTLMRSLGNMLSKSNATVKIVSEDRISDGAFMQFDVNTNTILISRDKIDRSSPQKVIRAFAHEVIHSVTVYNYSKSDKNAEEQAFYNLINDMYKKYKDLSNYGELETRNEKNAPDQYGFKNELEFIAEVMTNPIFQEKLRKLENESKDTSFFTKLVNLLRRLLGIPVNNEIDTLIDTIVRTVENNPLSPVTGSEIDMLLNIEVEEDPKEKRKLYEVETVAKKLTKTVNDIKDGLEESIKVYDRLIKKEKDPAKIKIYSEKLKSLLSDINSFSEAKQWNAVALFASQLKINLKSLQARFQQEKLDNKNINKTIYDYQRYLSANSLVENLGDLLAFAQANPNELGPNMTQKELQAIEAVIIESNGLYTQLNKSFDAFIRKAVVNKLNNRKYAYEVIYRWEQKLKAQHKALGITEPVESYMTRLMNTTHKQEIDEEVKNYILDIIENPQFDITSATMMFNTSMNTNSKMVTLFQNIINEVRNKIIERTRAADFELKELFDEFTAGRKSASIKTLYGNMLEETEDGYFLKGDYSMNFQKEYDKQFTAFMELKEKVIDKYGRNSSQFARVYLDSDFKKWTDTNIITQNGKSLPHPKWKNDLSSLTPLELKVLNKFKEIAETTNKQTFGFNTLIKQDEYGNKYYQLPSVTKSDLERALVGDVKGIVKDKWDELKIQTDDVEYAQSEQVDEKGNPLRFVRVHYRGRLPKEKQSLDLFSLFRLEEKNGINYEEKNNSEMYLETLVEISKNKTYYSALPNRTNIFSKNRNRNNLVTKSSPGTSNTYKKLLGLIESNVYDVMHKEGLKVNKIDSNKIIKAINGWTAAVGMTFNEVTAATNVLNGKAQMFLEYIGKGHISGQSIRKAEAMYLKLLPENLADLNSPVKMGFTNQLNEEMDSFGQISVSQKQAFLKNTAAKALGNPHALQFMQEGGEHWLQSTLTMAVLGDIKVMDAKGNLIDKDGNVVNNIKKAASLLDMYSKDANNKLVVSPLVKYTTKSTGILYDQGGKEKIMALVKKKIADTMGVYDPNLQPEVQKHWYGKLFMMFRKYLIPMGVARFRGFVHINKKISDLEPEQRFYNDALQEMEEGTYTSSMRFIITSLIPSLRKMKFNMLAADWANLTEYEKRNMYKALTEVVLTSALLPALGTLAQLAAEDDPDNEKFMYFLLLQTRRLESELSSYRSITEQYRITKSPIPGVRTLENATKLIIQLYNIDEVYTTGPRKGQYKVRRAVEKLTPILNSRSITYKEKYEFIQNITSSN